MPPAKKSTAKRSSTKMSQDHKDALAKGRQASRAVRAYLDALEANKPKRGRQRSPESIQKRLDELEHELAGASAFERLGLLAETERLQTSLDQLAPGEDLGPLRKAFVKWAKVYGEAKGVSYATWRAAGVSAEDLRAAKITRSGR
jgi:hypothetical protein